MSLANVALAADVLIRAAEIVGYGIFDTSSSVSERGFSSSSLAKDNVRGVRFLEYTTDIPGKLGTNFGFQFIVNSTPIGKAIRVTTVIKFPEQGMQQPKGRHYAESRDTHEVILGQKSLHGYGFDEEWEIVPGTWVFELWYRDARLIKKTFTVLEPTLENASKTSVAS
jgi:hypothetical protein